MKKRVYAAALAALVLAGAAGAQTKTTLAVLPFTGGEAEEGETIAELFSFSDDLNAAFAPIPRTSITRAMSSEQKFQMTTGMTDPETIAALGRQLGAQYVVAGNIAKLGNRNLLIISIVKIDDLRQIAGDIQTYGNIEEIQDKLPDMVRNIIAASKIEASKLEKLAVVPVEMGRNVDSREADTLAQILSINLVKSGKYAVYPRTATLEQVNAEYHNQLSGDTADENLVDMGKGDNPLLVLSLAARRLGARNMFNASIINLESGVQVVGRSVNYERLDDGVETMGSLAQELTGVTIPGVAVLTPKPTSVPAPTSVPIPTPAPVPAPVLAPTSKPVPTPAPGKTVPSGLSLEDALTWLSSNAVEGGTYTITLKTNETIPPKTLAYGEKNVSLTLEGDTSERGIILNSPGALFTVEKGVSLILGAHVTLWGQSSNTASLVRVNSGGTLMMKAGSKITGNTMNSPSGNGGGVYVAGGTFTMKSGAIRDNTSSSYGGGGVYVSSSSNSRFIKMPGAVIYGSNADSTLKNTARRNGQAVYVDTSPSKRHNATAGSGVSLDSSVNGAAGGWECAGRFSVLPGVGFTALFPCRPRPRISAPCGHRQVPMDYSGLVQ